MTITAPRDDLIRAVLRAESVKAGDGNTMVGAPAVFNEWTEIASIWEGNFLERLAPGAFKNTLKQRRNQIKVLFNHGMDPQIGDKPLGKPDVMREDPEQFWTETPLAETSYNADIAELLRTQALDGMSIRFSVVREEWNEEPEKSDHNPKGLPERTIKEVKLYEFGPVTFPAYEATSAGIRSREAFALWRATPERERATLLKNLSDAGDSATSEVEQEGRTADSGIRLKAEDIVFETAARERLRAVRSRFANL